MSRSPIPVLPVHRAAALALAAISALAITLAWLLTAPLAFAAATRSVSYHHYRLQVPADWPVYRLARTPATCVRFDRHAVYLGVPSDDQRCPPAAAGRTEAILVEPLAGSGQGVRAAVDAGSAARIVDRRAGVVVTATWNRDPQAISRALGVASLARGEHAARATPPPAQADLRRRSGSMRAAISSPAGGPASPGAVYSGLGFDACSAPSAAAMSDWTASPYRAVGIYIGGANAACAQPNLTAAWVSAESAAGWHVLPIYVGLQAPGNSCGCAAISTASAAGEGTAAATDAVAQAQALGIGAGNPIFFDMEAYTRGGSATAAALAFLAAWTTQLHDVGYLSAVYSSEESGIADLVAEVGTGYTEPDEIWIANWNGTATTADPLVPTAYWNGDRVHQYEGASEQTYGGVTIDVDQNAISGPTAASGTAATTSTSPTLTPVSTTPVATLAQAPPSATSAPTIAGAAAVDQTLTEGHATWSGSPTAYSYQWEVCGSSGACAPIAGATAPQYTVASADLGQVIRVVETAENVGGTGSPVISAPTTAVTSIPTTGYWLVTPVGNVVQSPGERWFGSAVRAHVSSIVGLAPDPHRRGYWLADTAGRVFAYGNARPVGTGRYGRAIRGIAASFRGAWLYTASGNVFSIAGAPWYGSALHEHTAPIVGMSSTRTGRGYWLVEATGQILAFGDAAALPAVSPAHPIRGIVAAPGGGAWVYTVAGDVLPVGSAVSYGSPVDAGVSGIDVTGMTPTADGRGYWLVDSTGQVFAYGDAPTFAGVARARSVVAIGS